MNYKVYILKSELTGRNYIGMTSDLENRLDNHNRGSNTSTRSGRPWKIVYTEEYSTRDEALTRERQIKSYKGGDAFKRLFTKYGRVA